MHKFSEPYLENNDENEPCCQDSPPLVGQRHAVIAAHLESEFRRFKLKSSFISGAEKGYRELEHAEYRGYDLTI